MVGITTIKKVGLVLLFSSLGLSLVGNVYLSNKASSASAELSTALSEVGRLEKSVDTLNDALVRVNKLREIEAEKLKEWQVEQRYLEDKKNDLISKIPTRTATVVDESGTKKGKKVNENGGYVSLDSVIDPAVARLLSEASSDLQD
jgi:predicted transcriptional regulator